MPQIRVHLASSQPSTARRAPWTFAPWTGDIPPGAAAAPMAWRRPPSPLPRGRPACAPPVFGATIPAVAAPPLAAEQSRRRTHARGAPHSSHGWPTASAGAVVAAPSPSAAALAPPLGPVALRSAGRRPRCTRLLELARWQSHSPRWPAWPRALAPPWSGFETALPRLWRCAAAPLSAVAPVCACRWHPPARSWTPPSRIRSAGDAPSWPRFLASSCASPRCA
mmetsp:Transcript_9458/g.31448  ORF Transcript_9458/g.31448 Transcript_9458/m.31448 type:complete len:223 (+) Transcript_9458:426-1094(+)|eukprot:scaffold11797_cov123-Isochrysis_galbana.AAC.5